jgi:hypothetical protein
MAPHAAHVPPTHASVTALQLVPLQHGWPIAPHRHIPPAHVRFTLHVEPAQQVSLNAPHGPHVPVPAPHTRPELHVLPEQHG